MLTEIGLNIRNNTGFPQKVSILGYPNNRDTANANTKYCYDLTTESFNDKNTVTIEIKNVGQTSYQTYTTPLLSSTIQGVADSLNTLGFGYFYVDGNEVCTYNNAQVFNALNILPEDAPTTTTTTSDATTTTTAPTTTTTAPTTTTTAPTTTTTTVPITTEVDSVYFTNTGTSGGRGGRIWFSVNNYYNPPDPSGLIAANCLDTTDLGASPLIAINLDYWRGDVDNTIDNGSGGYRAPDGTAVVDIDVNALVYNAGTGAWEINTGLFTIDEGANISCWQITGVTSPYLFGSVNHFISGNPINSYIRVNPTFSAGTTPAIFLDL